MRRVWAALSWFRECRVTFLLAWPRKDVPRGSDRDGRTAGELVVFTRTHTHRASLTYLWPWDRLPQIPIGRCFVWPTAQHLQPSAATTYIPTFARTCLLYALNYVDSAMHRAGTRYRLPRSHATLHLILRPDTYRQVLRIFRAQWSTDNNQPDQSTISEIYIRGFTF